mmetsp:Transcript_11811/g.30823  ORF Transcript_11811/g.30823 Transcript_11811/m.30823 type:complete len:261 (-) Transcript_11811:188-970(-)
MGNEATKAVAPPSQEEVREGPPKPVLMDEFMKGPCESSLLDEATCSALASRVQSELRRTWRRLFNSSQNGQSFNRFLKHVCGKGPSILVVRDAKGNIFGAFAPESWTIGPKFHGNYGCFLFTVKPKFEIHGASGENRNFQYINEGCEALPNGCALGGTIEPAPYFGLWLYDDFERGESSGLCTTFDAGIFERKTVFEIVEVEVWALREPRRAEDGYDEEEEDLSKSQNLVQRNRETADFLALAGREMISDSLPPEPIDED